MSQGSKRSLQNIKKLIEVAQQNSKPEDTFLVELNRTIEKAQVNRKPSAAYKPSSMFCVRNMYYQRTATKPDSETMEAGFVGICESGSARHEHLQQYVIKMAEQGFDCEWVDVEWFIKHRKLKHLEIISKQGYETKVFNKNLNMRFLCDGIIKYKNHYYIIEIKTEASFKFNRRTGVDIGHTEQATAYSMSFEIDDVLFVYENRDFCSKKTYMLKVTDELKFAVLSKIELSDEYVKKHKAPPIPKGFPCKLCNYCNYKSTCSR